MKPDRTPESVAEGREQEGRWTIYVCPNGHSFWTRYDATWANPDDPCCPRCDWTNGEKPAPAEPIEVVPASSLTELRRQRDEAKRLLRVAYAWTDPEDVPADVLAFLNPEAVGE